MPEHPSTPPVKITQAVIHVLLSLVDGDAHAYGIMKSIPLRTKGAVKIAPGSLHYTLAKLEEVGMVEEVPSSAAEEGDPRRRYFRLTPYGRAVLSEEATRMAGIVEFARERDLVSEGGAGG